MVSVAAVADWRFWVTFAFTFAFALMLLVRSGRRDAKLSIKLLSIAAKFACRSVAAVDVAEFGSESGN